MRSEQVRRRLLDWFFEPCEIPPWQHAEPAAGPPSQQAVFREIGLLLAAFLGFVLVANLVAVVLGAG